MALAAPSVAQEAATPAPQTVEAAELQSLVETLESVEDRERLLSDLKALIAAQAVEEPATDTRPIEGASALKTISDGLGRAGVEIMSLGHGLYSIPDAIEWLTNQWSNEDTREIWLEAIWKLAVIVAGGLIANLIARFLLRRPRRFFERMGRPRPWFRPPFLLSLNILRTIPAMAFAAAGYGMLAVVDPSEQTRLISLALINAQLIVAIAKAIANQALAPWAPNLRLSKLTDEMAMYCSIWWQRIVSISIFGYFGCQAALLLGLPKVGYTALVGILGIVVSGLLIALLLQNRGMFSGLIREAAERHERRGIFAITYHFADIWHIPAIMYVVAGALLAAADGIQGFLFFLKSSGATIAIFYGGSWGILAVQRVFIHGFALRSDVISRFPGMQARVDRYLPILRRVLQVLIGLLMIVLVLEAWNVDILTWLASEVGRVVVGRLAAIAAIVLIGLLAWEVVSSIIDRYLAAKEDEEPTVGQRRRALTLLPLAKNALRIIVGVIVVLMVLTEVGIDIAPILAGVGVVGLAVGFGAQTLVKDVITGVFILLEDSVAVGDVVTAGGHSGLVEAITIRSLRLRDLHGNVHTIPFSAVDTMTNMTKDFSYYLIEAGVAYRENYDEVVDVIREVGADLQADADYGPNILEPIEILGLDRFDDSAVVIRARIKTVPIKQWTTGREFNRRLKEAFDARGIEIPFPHQTLYFGEDKQGNAPPAHLILSNTKPEPRALAAESGQVEAKANAPKPEKKPASPRAMGDSDDGDADGM